MNKELLFLFKKPIDTLIGRTKTKPQETLEFTVKKQMETFPFNPPMNLSEEEQWMLALTNFEPTNTDFIITNGNNSFSVSTPGYWSSRHRAETLNRLREFIGLRAQNDIELHVEECR